MWLVALVLVVVLGWMLYAAGRRHAAQDIVQEVDAHVAVEELEELARAGARKAIVLACGGALDDNVLARLTDDEIALAVVRTLGPVGEAGASVPKALLVRMIEVVQYHRGVAQEMLVKGAAGRMAEQLDGVIEGIVESLASDALDHAVRKARGLKTRGELGDRDVVAGLIAVMKAEEQKLGPADRARDMTEFKERALKAALRMRDRAAAGKS